MPTPLLRLFALVTAVQSRASIHFIPSMQEPSHLSHAAPVVRVSSLDCCLAVWESALYCATQNHRLLNFHWGTGIFRAALVFRSARHENCLTMVASRAALPSQMQLCRSQLQAAGHQQAHSLTVYNGLRGRKSPSVSRNSLAAPSRRQWHVSTLRAQGVAEHHSETAEVSSAVELDGAAAVSALVTERPDLSGVTEWELDFCSRPLLDERGKRVWELLVCDASRQLQYSEYFPSNRINSATLKDALLRVMDDLDAPKPQKIRFFR